MAEGADGEEEIQFLRTVSDAVALSALIKLTVKKDSQSIIVYYIIAL